MAVTRGRPRLQNPAYRSADAKRGVRRSTRRAPHQFEALAFVIRGRFPYHCTFVLQSEPSIVSRRQGKMRLGAFFNPTGHHVASWRHPDAQADAGINFPHYVEIARTAERAKFDMVFLADNLCVRDASMEAISRSAQYIANFEPITLLAALSSVTTHIGLVATASTSYNEPFHVARKFASLDHLSGGRAGWNLVTSGKEPEAKNFGREKHYQHGERYERAREFAQVVIGLWDSWDDDAFVRDKESGLFFHPDKLHPLNHKG